jgi:hypothetical protein
MSSRIIQLPLSGRDRRHYVAELRKAEQAYQRHVQEAAMAHAASDRALVKAHRLDCAAWSALQFIGGDADPSPLIADAIHGRCELLEVQCRHCNHTDSVDLTLAVWPRGNQVHTLHEALYCRPCLKEYGKKRRPDLVALRTRDPAEPEPPAAVRARKNG